MAFHSTGFPIEKAIEYTKLRKPYIINNLEMQFDIQDRRSVYAILEKEGIEIPRYAILDRESDDPESMFSTKRFDKIWIKRLLFYLAENTLIEHDDHVEVNGVVLNKPFVEKPVSAEDHNIYMYYPTSAGKFSLLFVEFKSFHLK